MDYAYAKSLLFPLSPYLKQFSRKFSNKSTSMFYVFISLGIFVVFILIYLSLSLYLFSHWIRSNTHESVELNASPAQDKHSETKKGF